MEYENIQHKLKLGCVCLIILFSTTILFAETELLKESFEGDKSNYDANMFNDGSSDYFDVFHKNSQPAAAGETALSIDQNYLVVIEDSNAPDPNGNPLGTSEQCYIVLSAVDVSAYSEVKLTIALAELTVNSFEWTVPDYIDIQYAFDGNIATTGDANVNSGTYTTFGSFRAIDPARQSDIDSSPTLYLDANLDGDGEGAGLTNTLTDYSFTTPVTGTQVSIRIVVSNGNPSEELALDNIRIYGVGSAASPICLSSFNAQNANGSVNVTWQTASEINNSHFNLYRNNELITRVEGAGSSTEMKQYSFIDRHVIPGRTYTYTLADVDYENIERKYEDRSIVLEIKNELIDTDFNMNAVYPNPFNPTVSIAYDMKKPANLEVLIYNGNGVLIEELLDCEMGAGFHEIIWNAKQRSSGIYILKMQTANTIHIQKLILMK